MKTTFILSNALILAMIVSLAGCQKHYDMVDPPFITNYGDDLDEEDYFQEAEQEYFVTRFGEGLMDGSSWDNAMDVEGFRKLLTGTIDLSGTTIYLSQGKYLMSDEPGAGLTIKKNVKSIMGGFHQMSTGKDLSRRNVTEYATFFSGDVNGNGTADKGDCGLVKVTKGFVEFDGITFQHGYISDAESNIENFGSGLYLDGNPADTRVDLKDCVIKECVSDITSPSVKQGGAALYVLSGLARLSNIRITGNRAYSRGGAVRTADNNAVVFLDRCCVNGNDIGNGNGDWGCGVQLTNGSICINNSSFAGNTGKGGAINGSGAVLLANSTVIGNETDKDYGAYRCETPKGGKTRFINNLMVSQNSLAPGFILNGSNKEALSLGYNIHMRAQNFTMADNDTGVESLPEGTFSAESGLYEWNVSQYPALSTYASLKDVTEGVRSFAPATSPIGNLGELFYEWIKDEGFGTDARGIKRNSSRMQPGAYDGVLK